MLQILHRAPSQLKPWQGNPRINDHAVNTVAKSISRFGFNVPILCTPDFLIIAGHTRWKAALRLKLKSVPVVVLKMSDTDRRAFAVADNKTGELATCDSEPLIDLLQQLQSEQVDLSTVGYSDAELQALLTEQRELDWSTFDEALTALPASDHVLFPVKVLVVEKDAVKKAVEERLREYHIDDKDPAVAAGKLFKLLLKVNS